MSASRSASVASNSSSRSDKPIRCLVIQLARLGDTLQTLMALRAAKQLYPNLEIHFVAREKFAHAARKVPWLQSVITLPTDELLGPVIRGEKNETQALGEVARWLAPLVKDSWDFVVNWSYSDASSWLTALLPGKVKLGFTRRKDSSFACADGWSQYIQGIVQGGVQQNIHLTDILTTQLLTALQIHVGEPATDGNSPVTSKTFFTLGISEDALAPMVSLRNLTTRWIGIQLGASQESKTWEPEKWAKLASLILRRHSECSIVLLGGKEDQPRLKRFMSELDSQTRDHSRLISLVGETDFDLWASVVARCHWIFGADTAAIHLASVLGTRVVNVSVGPVRWEETGPYGNGHYVIAGEVRPESVYSAWSYAITEWSHRRQHSLERHASLLGLSETLDGARIYRSRIRNTNDGGGVVYEPVLKMPLAMEEWSSSVMGHIARAWYCGWVPPVGQELSRERVRPELIRALRELEDSTQILLKICEQASHTATFLSRRSSRLKSEKLMGLRDREELQALGKKLMDLDLLAERLGRTHPSLRAFSQMSKVLMHNLRGEQLSEIGRESVESYQQLKEGVTIFRDWVRHTMNIARPRAVLADAQPEGTPIP